VNFIPLHQRNFALLWWAGLISITGDWALRVALPLYVLRLTGSPAAVSSVVLAGFLASLLFGTVAGPYVDRWDRRRVLLAVGVVQALVLLPLLAVGSAGRAWIVVAVGFAESALAQFSGPAQNALLPRLVPAGQLAAANSLNSLSNWIGRLAGPAAGGLVAAALGLGGAALLDAATFAVAAGLCALITGRHRADRGGQQPRHLQRELAEGLRAITANRITRAILIFLVITAIGEGLMDTLFAVYVTRALHGGSTQLGWLLSAQAVGGILGSLAGPRVTLRFRPVTQASACFAIFGLLDLAIFNYPRWGTALWPVIALFFLIGIPGVLAFVATLTLFQTQAPDRLRGRMFAVLEVGQAAAAMLGAAVAGQLGRTISVVTLLTAQGTGYLLAGLLLRMLAGRGPESFSAAAAAAGSTGPRSASQPQAPTRPTLQAPAGLTQPHAPAGLTQPHAPAGLTQPHAPAGPTQRLAPAGLMQQHAPAAPTAKP
jgi:MFS family permease